MFGSFRWHVLIGCCFRLLLSQRRRIDLSLQPLQLAIAQNNCKFYRYCQSNPFWKAIFRKNFPLEKRRRADWSSSERVSGWCGMLIPSRSAEINFVQANAKHTFPPSIGRPGQARPKVTEKRKLSRRRISSTYNNSKTRIWEKIPACLYGISQSLAEG